MLHAMKQIPQGLSDTIRTWRRPTLPKITRPLAARQMLPRTPLHLFMTGTLVILRLNYRAGAKDEFKPFLSFFSCLIVLNF